MCAAADPRYWPRVYWDRSCFIRFRTTLKSCTGDGISVLYCESWRRRLDRLSSTSVQEVRSIKHALSRDTTFLFSHLKRIVRLQGEQLYLKLVETVSWSNVTNLGNRVLGKLNYYRDIFFKVPCLKLSFGWTVCEYHACVLVCEIFLQHFFGLPEGREPFWRRRTRLCISCIWGLIFMYFYFIN